MKMSREKHLRLSDEEFNTLQERAAAACMSDSAYIRSLIMNKAPVVVDDRFFAAMEIIREFADKIDEVAMKTDNSVDMIDRKGVMSDGCHEDMEYTGQGRKPA